MHRFYIDPESIEGNCVKIGGTDAGHIARVLRLKPGDEIALCDGQSNEWTARILDVGKKNVAAELLSCRRLLTEPATRLTLYQGIQKAGKFEVVLQKGVELGVARFVPFDCRRAVAAPWKAKDAKAERYARVAYEAAKQCGRGALPAVESPISFETLVKRVKEHECSVLFWEEERAQSLRALLGGKSAPNNLALIIGPEGGIDPEEAEALCAAGAQCVTLGPRILRTETAGPVAAALALYELGQMEYPKEGGTGA